MVGTILLLMMARLGSFAAVIAWGSNDRGQTTVPPGLVNVVGISAGYNHSVALNADGTVSVWGDNSNGQVSSPFPIVNALDVSAGANATLIVLPNSVESWSKVSLNFPPEVTNVLNIATDGTRTTALRRDGTIVSWGGTLFPEAPPASLSNVVAIAPGMAVLADGSVASWAKAGAGGFPLFTPPADLTNVVAISTAPMSTIVLLADGSVRTFFISSEGSVPKEATNIVAVSVGGEHLALREDGRVISWPLSPGAGGTFNPAPDLDGITAIAVGNTHGLALRGETAPHFAPRVRQRSGVVGAPLALYAPATGEGPIVYRWQHNSVNVPGETNVILRLNSLQATNAGTYTIIASNRLGSAQQSFEVVVPVSVSITQPPSDRIAWLSGSADFEVHATGQDLRYQWLHDGVPLPGQTNASLRITNASWSDAGFYSARVSKGADSITSIEAKLTLTPMVWWGQFFPMNGETLVSRDLTPVITNVLAVSMNPSFGLVLQKDGLLHSWGALKSSPPLLVPTPISGIVAISQAGTSVAVREDGRVIKWDSGSWSLISNVTEVVQVSNDLHALRGDGTIQGPMTGLPTGLTNVSSFSAVGNNGGAVLFDGTLVRWGGGIEGQTTNSDYSWSNIVAVSVSPTHGLGLSADGHVQAWGWDSFFIHGRVIPEGLSNVVAVFAGFNTGMALTREGTLFRWGTWLPTSSNLFNVIAADSASGSGIAAVGEGAPQFPPSVRQCIGTAGEPLFLYARAVGEMPIEYQWLKDGHILQGETNVALSLVPFNIADAGIYTLTATNRLGGTSQDFEVYADAPTGIRWVRSAVENGKVIFEFRKPVPFTNYTLETAESLKGPWRTNAQQPEFDGLTGTFRLTDSTLSHSSQFYRFVQSR